MMPVTGKINFNKLEESKSVISKSYTMEDIVKLKEQFSLNGERPKKLNVNSSYSLSIQYSLSGLSFYRHDTGYYMNFTINTVEEASNLISLLTDQESDLLYDHTNLIFCSDRYVAIPKDLYDSALDNDYLYAKNIICQENEKIITSSSCNIMYIYVIDNSIIKKIRATSPMVDIVHTLQFLVEYGQWRTTQNGKTALYLSIHNNTLCYAIYENKKLVAMDSIKNCDSNKMEIIFSIINSKFNIEKTECLFDYEEKIASVSKKYIKKMDKIESQNYFEQNYL
ncbi:MAG: DUF3822 family protein [Bacteroidetes bacterium]|nr:DUF3822 family protein [Bacteroidota bacterium]